MTDQPLSYETVYILAMQLSRAERARLIAQIAPTLIEEPDKQPRRSLRGLLSGYGPAPSAEDIDRTRREMWSDFPREDVGS